MTADLKFDEKGLIPVVVQDVKTKKVLTLAYMNRESLEITLNEGQTCFFSRSRQQLWRKGETSGNFQKVVSVTADCDGDALLIEVDKVGPACHLGADSCFEKPIFGAKNDFSLEKLYELLMERKEQRPSGSYTTYLFDSGKEKILKKIGEECTEVVIAAMKNSKPETICELADLCYHALTLMVNEDVSVAEVLGELAKRNIVDKKIKQETSV